MGVAVQPESGNLAVAVDDQIWQFRNMPELAPRRPGRDLRRLLPAAPGDLYRSDRRPRDRMVWRRALGGQHAVLLLVHS